MLFFSINVVSLSVTKEVVAMGTGTKCIGQNKMRKTGKYDIKVKSSLPMLPSFLLIESMKMSKVYCLDWFWIEARSVKATFLHQ